MGLAQVHPACSKAELGLSKINAIDPYVIEIGDLSGDASVEGSLE